MLDVGLITAGGVMVAAGLFGVASGVVFVVLVTAARPFAEKVGVAHTLLNPEVILV